MFADDNSIENIQQLFLEFKKYLELQKKYTQLEVAEKLTILLSTLILVLLVVILGMVNRQGIWIEKLEHNPGKYIPEELRKAGEGEAVRVDLRLRSLHSRKL